MTMFYLTYVGIDECGRPYTVEDYDDVRIDASDEHEARALYRERLGIARLPKDVFCYRKDRFRETARVSTKVPIWAD